MGCMKSRALGILSLAISSLAISQVSAQSAAEPGVRRVDPALDKLLSPGAKVEKVAGGFQFVEGPVWNRKGGYLIFSDIPGNAIMTWSPSGGASVFRARIFEGEHPDGASVGTNGLTLDREFHIVAAEQGNRRVSRIEQDGAMTILA